MFWLVSGGDAHSESPSVVQAPKQSCLLIYGCFSVLLFVVQFYQKPLLFCCSEDVCDTHVSNNGQLFEILFLKLLGSKSRLMCISFFANNDAPKVQRSSANHGNLPGVKCVSAVVRRFHVTFGVVSNKPGRFHEEVPTLSWAGCHKAGQERAKEQSRA